MKYAEFLLDSFDDVCNHATGGVEVVKDMLAFFKRRVQIEDEYSKNLTKLAHTVIDAKKKYPSVQKGSLWDAWMMVATEVDETGLLHRSLSLQIGKLLVETYQNFVKENDTIRKSLVAEGERCRNELQDAYTSLKKAKDNRDKLLKEAEAAEEASGSKSAAVVRSTNPKDMSKLAGKAQMARDKAKASEIQVDQCQTICDEKQELYYKKWMPSVMDRFQALELTRIRFLKDTLTTCQQIEARVPTKVKSGCDRVIKVIEEINAEQEIDVFVDDHTGAEHYSKASVSSLQGSTKTGRVWKTTGVNNNFRSRFVVLMAQMRLLYCFESENSLKPVEVVRLERSRVRPIHESLFDRKNVILLHLSDDEGGQLHYFALDSENELFEWYNLLRACAMAVDPSEIMQLPRRVTSLSVTITEARHLVPVDPIRRSANPFCAVWLDRFKEASTSVLVNTLSPIWNERLLIDDSPSFQTLRIQVLSKSTFPGTRDVEIGTLEVPYSTLDRAALDSWFNLVPTIAASSTSQAILTAVQSASGAIFSGGDKGESNEPVGTMAIRIKTEIKNETLLPLVEYKAFLQALLNEDQVAVRALLDNVNDRDLVSRQVVRVWHASNCAISNLQRLIVAEIENTDDPAIIFRANSIATKSMDAYMKQISGEYLCTILSHVTKSIVASRQSCEVDLSRLEEGEDVKKNVKRLLGYVRAYLDVIYAGLDAVPSELRCLFNIIQEHVIKKFPEDKKIRYTSVSGFIFLRLICPAIISPTMHGLVTEIPDERSSRSLTLCAKVLQNLANIVGEVGTKEVAFAGEISDFVKDNMDEMRTFIKLLSTLPKSSGVSPKNVMDLARELESIRGQFERISAKISTIPNLSSHGSIVAVYTEVQRLGEKGDRLPRGRAMSSEAPTSPASSSPRLNLPSAPSPPLANLSRNHSPEPATFTSSPLRIDRIERDESLLKAQEQFELQEEE